MNHPLCRHCGLTPGYRSKGLCWTCSLTPAIRTLYVSTSKYSAGSPAQIANLLTCRTCGHIVGCLPCEKQWSGTCSTCKHPEPFRSERHARIAEMERRAELAMPLFGSADLAKSA